jgi:hypothetical protein
MVVSRGFRLGFRGSRPNTAIVCRSTTRRSQIPAIREPPGQGFQVAPENSEAWRDPSRSKRRFRYVAVWTASVSEHRVRATVVVLVALIGLVGCSSDGGGDATPTTRPPVTNLTTSTTLPNGAAEKQQVAAAYQAADKAFLDASMIPDPEFPAFLATHTGPMLDQSTKVLKAFKLQGLVGRLPANAKYRSEIDVGTVRIDADVAVFNVCAVDDSQRVEKSTGRVVGGSGIDTSLIQVAMQRVGGSWRLAERKELQHWSGEAGCAAR